MNFTKMHGLGNDFVVVADYKEVPKEVNQLAMDICNRNFGVGADGLVFILPSDKADFKMRIFNADGTEAEQCGNAIRCVAKYAYDHQLKESVQLDVETLAGIQQVTLHLAHDKVDKVEVDMGEPILKGELIPTALSEEIIIDQKIEIDGVTFYFTGVSMGNPHAIIYVENAKDFEVEKWGPIIEKHPLFPKKTNVEFVTVTSDEEMDMRVWERGVGQTLACGTGACATGVASSLTGRSSRNVTVHLKGGDLKVCWSEEDNHVYMTGEAREVFTGTWLGKVDFN